jgi:hypothetical protein
MMKPRLSNSTMRHWNRNQQWRNSTDASDVTVAKGKNGFSLANSRWAFIGALVLCLPCIVQAQITTFTPLATYDAGENIVSYFEYLALDCPDETACSYNNVISTTSRVGHTRTAAVITGFSLWTPLPDMIGKIAIRVKGSEGSAPGAVDLRISGLFLLPRNSKFSYRVQVAIIESTVEGFTLTQTGAACAIGKCPVPMTAPGAVPAGQRFLGFGLQVFDSDRPFLPLWGAVAVPVTTAIDPTSGNVSARLTCGTVEPAGTKTPTLSGPCETNWVAIAARPNNVLGGPANGLPLIFPLAPYTGFGAAAVNSPNPGTTTPTLTCNPHPKPSKGFVDVLGGFYLLAGHVSGGSFTPAKGNAYGMEVGVSSIDFSASGSPQLMYRMGLPVTQSVVGGLPPAVSPVTYLRLTTSICL